MGTTLREVIFDIGVWALVPVVTINDRVYSNVVSQQVSQILNEIKAAERV